MYRLFEICQQPLTCIETSWNNTIVQFDNVMLQSRIRLSGTSCTVERITFSTLLLTSLALLMIDVLIIPHRNLLFYSHQLDHMIHCGSSYFTKRECPSGQQHHVIIVDDVGIYFASHLPVSTQLLLVPLPCSNQLVTSSPASISPVTPRRLGPFSQPTTQKS